MLTRVLEVEVMDSPQEAADYDAMDHAEVNRVFVADFLAAAGLPPPGAEILDLGTGTAQIPIELCRAAPGLHILGIDLAENMLGLARRNVDRAGLRQISLERVDAKRLPYAEGRFAAVMSNSIVHHIPEPRQALAEAARVTAPGGLLFVRDLLRPDDDATVARLVDAYAAGANRQQRAMFEASLRAALSLDEIGSLVADLGFDPQTVAATSDRHWTWSARKPAKSGLPH
jgi:ubiquinone/menaquinone biosynthesis C-methylase UbiE